MNNRLIRKFTQAPAGLERTRDAYRGSMLRFILWLTIALNIVNMAYVVLADRQYDPWLDVVFLGIQFFLLWMVRRGHIITTSLVFSAAMWFFIAIGFTSYSHVTQPFYYAYLLIIIITAVLLNGTTAAVFAFLSIVMGLVSLFQDASGAAPTMWVITSLVMFTLTTLLLLVERHLDHVFTEIERQRQALQNENNDLQTEIAERQRVETARRESEKRYRQLVDLLPLALIVYNSNGELIFSNNEALTLMRLPDYNTLLESTIWDYIVPEQHDLARQRRELLRDGDFSQVTEYRLRRHDGEEILIEAGSLSLTFQGQPAVLSILKDVTDQKLIEEERRQAEAVRIELEQQKKYVQLRENFMTMMSHEIRTPLTIISSSKDLLHQHYDRMTPERRQIHYDRIGEQVKHMVAMLDDIMTLSNANAGGIDFVPAPLDINAFVYELFEEFKSDIDDHTVTLDDHVNWGTCNVDGNLLRPILVNLLSNAVKYSPAGSEVRLELDREGDDAIFTVKDRGIGIDEASEIFKPFYRSHSVQHIAGAGLGLAIAYRCAELHGGTIHYAPREDGGTIFTVRLPLDCNPKDAILADSDYNRRMS